MQKANPNDIIGKYYENVFLNKDGIKEYYKIIGFEEDCYIAEYYSFDSFGKIINENHFKLSSDFYECKNFKEIEQKEFELVLYFYQTGGKYEYDESK